MSATWEIREGDCLALMAEMPDQSVDAVVTDPPYGIGFMGHAWDQPGEFAPVRANGKPAPFASGRKYPGPHLVDGMRRFGGPLGVGHTGRAGGVTDAGGAMHAGRYDLSPAANARFQAWCEAWAGETLRVLKPGGHMLVFGGTRTYHRMVSGIEDAGFEVRDQLAWLFGSGFPKSRQLGEGWGTALKPGHEPILLARAPCEGPASANFAQHRTGGLNVGACALAIGDVEEYKRNCSGDRGHNGTRPLDERGATDLRMGGGSAAGARWPANVAIDEEAAAMLDEQTGELVSGANPTRRRSDKFRNVYGDFAGQEQCEPARGRDVGGASRFFYCAKVSREEREIGMHGFPAGALNWSNGDKAPGSFQANGTERSVRNHHPTVKPIALMRWLVRLITPPGGTVLDPFAGSGSTGISCLREGFSFIGIDRDPQYVAIARARIAGDAPLINAAAEVSS